MCPASSSAIISRIGHLKVRKNVSVARYHQTINSKYLILYSNSDHKPLEYKLKMGVEEENIYRSLSLSSYLFLESVCFPFTFLQT